MAQAIASINRPAVAHRWRLGAVAVLTVTAVNTLLYAATRAAGIEFKLAEPGKEAHQLVIWEVLGATLAFALIGWGTLALLERVTRRGRVIWAVVAALVLLVSYGPVLAVEASTGTKVLLSIFHFTVAAALFPLLRAPRA